MQLVEPFEANLKEKKARMKAALDAYSRVAEYKVAEVSTISTFRIAELYHDLSRALLSSQRPADLNKEELEQYNILLEEQAYPFEEKAIQIHEANAQRIAMDIYDEWIQKSFAELVKLLPVRYAKSEKGDVFVETVQ